MAYGEVYTALQSGVIDAAENNETALVGNNHGEVAKYYMYTGHQIVPDMLIINAKRYNEFTDDEKESFRKQQRKLPFITKMFGQNQLKNRPKSQNKNGRSFYRRR